MANKKNEDKITDREADIVLRTKATMDDRYKREIEALHQKNEALAGLFMTIGEARALGMMKSFAGFIFLLKIKKLKDSREYYTKYGMNWEQTCKYLG
ncbi:MAG: hypothetical protein HZB62_10595 [Nitrospirae bacterium]|nr:hypothetical protein [Nitrospirota bacterium]